HVTGWLDEHEWGQKTRLGAITAVKRAFRWARKQGIVETDPLEDLERPPDLRPERVMKPDQVLAPIAPYPQGDPVRDLLVALRKTGARPGELADLTAAGVDAEAGTWTVKNKTRRKTREPTRTIYLTGAMVALGRRLVAAYPEGPIFRNAGGRPWTR